jgi:serine/threonine protein kinase
VVIPPEQVEGKTDLDARSDLYQLGVVLFETRTRSHPVEETRMERPGEVRRKRYEIRPLDPVKTPSRVASSRHYMVSGR